MGSTWVSISRIRGVAFSPVRPAALRGASAEDARGTRGRSGPREKSENHHSMAWVSVSWATLKWYRLATWDLGPGTIWGIRSIVLVVVCIARTFRDSSLTILVGE